MQKNGINPAKKYMLDYRDIVLQIRSLIRARDQHLRDVGRYEDAFERATKSTSRLRAIAISGTPDHDGMANAVLEMIRYQDGARGGGNDSITEQINAMIRHQAEMLGARLAMIERLSDERYKSVMVMRYVEGASWDMIIRTCAAKGSGIERQERMVYYIHGKALEEIRAMMQNCSSLQ